MFFATVIPGAQDYVLIQKKLLNKLKNAEVKLSHCSDSMMNILRRENEDHQIPSSDGPGKM